MQFCFVRDTFNSYSIFIFTAANSWGAMSYLLRILLSVLYCCKLLDTEANGRRWLLGLVEEWKFQNTPFKTWSSVSHCPLPVEYLYYYLDCAIYEMAKQRRLGRGWFFRSHFWEASGLWNAWATTSLYNIIGIGKTCFVDLPRGTLARCNQSVDEDFWRA